MEKYLDWLRHIKIAAIYTAIALGVLAFCCTIFENKWFLYLTISIVGLYIFATVVGFLFSNHVMTIYGSDTARSYRFKLKDSLHELHKSDFVKLTDMIIFNIPTSAKKYPKDFDKFYDFNKQYHHYAKWYQYNKDRHRSNKYNLAQLHRIKAQVERYLKKQIKELK